MTVAIAKPVLAFQILNVWSNPPLAIRLPSELAAILKTDPLWAPGVRIASRDPRRSYGWGKSTSARKPVCEIGPTSGWRKSTAARPVPTRRRPRFRNAGKNLKIEVLNTSKTYRLTSGKHKFWTMKNRRIGFDRNYR